jgi:hypothetical protein
LSISGECGGFEQSRDDVGAEELTIPMAMLVADLRGVLACVRLSHRLSNTPEGLVISSGGKGIFVLAMGGIFFRSPVPQCDPLDELGGDGVSLNGKGVVGIAFVDVVYGR